MLTRFAVIMAITVAAIGLSRLADNDRPTQAIVDTQRAPRLYPAAQAADLQAKFAFESVPP